MKKVLKIAAIAGVALGADIAPAYPQAFYDNSPRIIHVPQGQAYGAAPVVIDDESVVARPPKSHRKTAKSFAPRIRTEQPPELPKQSLEALPSSSPKRAMLTAPPIEGPTPVRPTPRWRNAAPLAPLPPTTEIESSAQ